MATTRERATTVLTTAISPELAEGMTTETLNATCERYEIIISRLDADEDSEQIGELERDIHVMEAELESRRIAARVG
jgi:hypothetical protein